MGVRRKGAHARVYRTRAAGETPYTARRPFDAPQPQAIHQPRGADSYEGVREEETSAEVRGVAQEARGRGWVARVAGTCAGGFFGRFAVAVPRTLRNPFSLFRHDCRGGHDPPQTKPTPLPAEQAHTTRRQ